MPPPDRWDEYQALGSVIPGTKFIAFKVPLKKEICRNLPENLSFSPDQLVQKIEESGKHLGLVIDLTFTRKYYDGQYFVKRDIQYEKIFTKGHDVPSDDVVQRFVEAVDDFNANNTDADAVIGVHCTHGVNRTGYLICRYMIDHLKMDPDEAIALFGDARGYPIERENYLSDLKIRPLSSDNLASPSQNDVINDQHNSAYSAEFGQEKHRHASTCKMKKSKAPCKKGADQVHGRRRSPVEHSSHEYRRGGSSARYRGAASGRAQQHEVYSSPLQRLETSVQEGWQNAVKSGWGSSQGRGYKAKSFSRYKGGSDREPYKHYHDDFQKYSWRKSEETRRHAGSDRSQVYRGRREAIRGGHNQDLKGNGQADTDTFWHQRNMDDSSGPQGSGRGRWFSGYPGNPGIRTQDWPLKGFRGGGNNGGQRRGGRGGRGLTGRNGGTAGWSGGMAGWNGGTAGWNRGMAGWNGGMAGWNSGRAGWDGESAERAGWNS